MTGRILLLTPLGIFLWSALFASIFAAQAGHGSQTDVSATPTIDRLAAPPTVENPNQADDGAQLFWLHCQPCHGDRGQGLTDEWRAQYPPEDQNCWESGCHGDRPYENGFTLPDNVPALIGNGSLARFETLGQVHVFTSSAMPFQMPGHLTDEEYLAIVAYMGRAHDVWDGTTLDAERLNSIRLRPATGEDNVEEPETATDNEFTGPQGISELSSALLWGLAIGLLLIIAGGAWLWRRYMR